MSSSTLPTLVQDPPPAGSGGSHETEGARLDSGLSGLDKPAPLPAFPVSKAYLLPGQSEIPETVGIASQVPLAAFSALLHLQLPTNSPRLPACTAQAPPPHPAPLPPKHVTSFSLRPRPLPFLHFPLGGRRGLGVLKSSDFLLLSAPASLPPATMSSGSRSPRSLLGNHLISSPPPPPAFNQPASRQRGTCALQGRHSKVGGRKDNYQLSSFLWI
ncbi:PREDICTED: proline-rich receptor-like protein kinase PERK9 [Bison bison bison]|uniref:Proline-rich receptor-like protein kinase PERK9 n=1 Tax=Bison bison bison TaxID=43346 RepID=A0A6P3HGQ2_BISBB|nr:PREDICTED: proline-rich receptor-like protein kinase PERK9 [Bison bison bison]